MYLLFIVIIMESLRTSENLESKFSWELDSLKNVSIENAGDIYKKSQITDKEAEILSQTDKPTLYLPNLKNITPKQAEILSKFKWECLNLSWLGVITSDVANQLIKFKWERLSLYWLKTIDDKSVKYLSKFEWKYLDLRWLERITMSQVLSLSKFKSHWLELYWLKTIELDGDAGELNINFVGNYFATKSWKKLFLSKSDSNLTLLKRILKFDDEIIGKVRYDVRWPKKLELSHFEAEFGSLQVIYNSRYLGKILLPNVLISMWISAKKLSDWLNEYKKEVDLSSRK